MSASTRTAGRSHAAATVVASAWDLYRVVHRHPELAGEERTTAARLARWLRADGYDVTAGVGGHGVVATLRNGPGPVVMLRTELDALPVREDTGLPYASTRTVAGADGRSLPVMHACGHDLHLAAVAGAARVLAGRSTHWRGTVMVVGQPAEETLHGARAMLEDGLFERFGRPDVILAQHLAPMPAGMVAHATGTLMAASQSLRVVVHGRGGHAGARHLAVDPLLVAAAIALGLRGVGPADPATDGPAVVSVGSLHSGTSANVVPETATLELTVRAPTSAAVRRLAAAVRRLVASEAEAAGCPAPPSVLELAGSPPLVPDRSVSADVLRVHRQHLGEERVARCPPLMAAEDVCWLTGPGSSGGDPVQLVYWLLGSAGPRQWSAAAPGGSAAEKMAALPPNHSPRFAPDHAALLTGISALVTAAASRLDQD